MGTKSAQGEVTRVVEFCSEYFEFWPRIDVDNFNGFLLLVTGAKSRFPLLETTEPEIATPWAFSNFLVGRRVREGLTQ